MTRRVAVVPHTHWDREWYLAFPAFRLRLVAILDDLVALIDADPGYSHFLLDGQMALVDDYLALRPEAEPRLRRLVGSGRLSMGPWYTLMDEFAVSGETIVRNLQLGLGRAAGFGEAMPVGYLPDMFGHVGQMPQVLRAAGLSHAVVWRGVPAAIGRTGFWWRSPDGSTVRAEYLPVGYSNGAHLPSDTESLVRRLDAHDVELSAFFRSPAERLLLMAGTDHQAPQPGLPALLAEANRSQKDFELEITSLPAFLAGAQSDGLPSWTGELRSGARANLLMGVHSNRVDVKMAAARAERALEALAEPLATLWTPAGRWPGAALADAWRQVILNSAHDSICACSSDDVGLAVLHRYGEATAAALAISAQALEWAGLGFPGTAPVVINPSPRARGAVVELELPADAPVPGAQVLAWQPAAETEKIATGTDLPRVLGELAEEGWLPRSGATSAALMSSADGVELVLERDATRDRSPDLDQVMAEVWAQAGAHRDLPLRVRVRVRPSQRVAVVMQDVPGYGWSAWPEGPGVAQRDDAPGMSRQVRETPVTASDQGLDNRLVVLTVDRADGTFSLNGLAGFDRLVDGGDAGDTYNYSPPPGDLVVDRPESVEIVPVEQGPVRGRLRVVRRYRWPAALEDGCRSGVRDVTVVTDLELHAGSRLVRVSTHLDNPCRDHRLRTLFPLPSRAAHSVAECAYGTTRRPLDAEGGRHETALATYPSRRFVTAGGLTVTHEGLLEYEVTDDGWTLALTLLRATGVLSRPAPSYRPNAAGPAIPLEGTQMIGPLALRYAVALGEVDPYRLTDEAWLPLAVVRAAGGGRRPPRGSLLEVTGAEVSALRRVDDAVELRVFNPTDAPTTVGVPNHSGWLVDLRGSPIERWGESFTLRAWGIATARLEGDVS